LINPLLNYWLLTTEFPPDHGGGISKYCFETIRMLKELGVRPQVFVSTWGLHKSKQISDCEGTRIIRFDPDVVAQGRGLQGVGLLSYAFKAMVHAEAEIRGLPDVIEAQDYLGIAYFLLQEKLTLSEWLRNTPICLTLHTPEYVVRPYNEDTIYRFPKFWTDEMEKFCLRAADALWSPSHRLVRALGSDFEGLQVPVIRNPFRQPVLDFDSSVRKGLYYFGRMQAWKGFQEMISAFAELVDHGFSETLNIIGGDGCHPMYGVPMLDVARRKYQKLFDKELIVAHGLLQPDDAFALLKTARIVVIPSRFENFPYAALESMSLERAILCSKQGGHAELIEHEKNGFVFDHNIEGDFKRQLAAAWLKTDEQLAAVGANAARTVREACDPSVIGAMKLAALKAAIADHSPVEDRIRYPFIRIGRVGPAGDHEQLPTISSSPGMLSVIIPYFNMGAYLEEAIDSIVNCDYHTLEILVSNAESTDPLSIAKFYALADKYQKDPRFKFINVRNKGLAFSRNDGALRATGEYLTFLDPDDKVRSSYYSHAIKVLERYRNVGFVGCWVQYFGENNGNFISWNPEPPYVLFHNTMNTAAMVIRRRVFLAHGMNDLNMSFGMEDYESMVRMVGAGFGGVVIPEILFDYRVRGNSMMRRFTRINDVYCYERIAAQNPAIFRDHVVGIVGLLNSNGPGFRHENPLIASWLE
jgi:glycosyltransferase involved in cell wall biosynthesis